MLNISIVLYRPKWEQEVLPLVEELLKVQNLQKIYLLDNSEKAWLRDHVDRHKSPFPSDKVRYMAMPENLDTERRIMSLCGRARIIRRSSIW